MRRLSPFDLRDGLELLPAPHPLNGYRLTWYAVCTAIGGADRQVAMSVTYRDTANRNVSLVAAFTPVLNQIKKGEEIIGSLGTQPVVLNFTVTGSQAPVPQFEVFIGLEVIP